MECQTNLPDSFEVFAVDEQDLAYKYGHLTSFKGLKIHNVTYDQLVKILGKPTFPMPNSDHSVFRSWVIRWDGATYEVYDYNTFDEHYTTTYNTTWWVGSSEGVHTLDFVNLIEELAKNYKDEDLWD